MVEELLERFSAVVSNVCVILSARHMTTQFIHMRSQHNDYVILEYMSNSSRFKVCYIIPSFLEARPELGSMISEWGLRPTS